MYYSTCGTREFAAPEYFVEGFEVGKTNKADIWSLGCILYYMITGKKAFYDSSGNLDFDKLKSAHLDDFEERIEDADCRALIRSCITKSPIERIDATSLLKVNLKK